MTRISFLFPNNLTTPYTKQKNFAPNAPRLFSPNDIHSQRRHIKLQLASFICPLSKHPLCI